MKRMLMTVAALGLMAGGARADWGGPGGPPPGAPGAGGAQVPQLGGPNTLLGMGDAYNGVAPDKYGLHPRLKRLFHLGGSSKSPPASAQMGSAQMGYGQNGPAYNPGAYGQAQGTLAFPNHPFVRSPRDFFMLDLNK